MTNKNDKIMAETTMVKQTQHKRSRSSQPPPPSAPLIVSLAAALVFLSTDSSLLVAGFSARPLRQPLALRIQQSSKNNHMIKKSPPIAAITRPNRRTLRNSLSLLSSTPQDDDETRNDQDDDEPQEEEVVVVEVVDNSLITSSQIESLQRGSLLSNIKRLFTSKNKMNRESLSKLGMSALLAYGFVSNVSGVIAVSCAWFIFSKKTGLSPLANKPAFLTIYAGFTVMLNVIRPARFAFAMAISPYFERIRKYFQRKFGVSPKSATLLMVVFINLLGTCTLMAAGVGLASLLSGVPVWGGL